MRVLGILLGVALLSACTNRSFTPVTPEALNVGVAFTVFAATTRARNADGGFGYQRSETLGLLELTVSVPPSHMPGQLDLAYANPRPDTQFTLAARKQFADPASFRARIRQEMDRGRGQNRDVTVFIHGYNATQAETAFRAAQLAYDLKLPGAQVIYSWPSKGRTLGYAYDYDSALFARDGLEKLLFELKATDARRIVLVAHSMGGLVMMETLRQIELRKPGWIGRHIGGVVMISPDLDIELFRLQMRRMPHVPQPFVVFVSARDNILGLSARLRGGGQDERLGNISSNDRIADLPIEIIDTTAFSGDAQTPHFVAGSSPAFIAMIKDVRSLQRSFEPDPAALKARLPAHPSGNRAATRLTLVPAR